MSTPLQSNGSAQNPLNSLDEWEDFVEGRYENETERTKYKGKEAYRQYDEGTHDTVKKFYHLNHKHQTLDFVKQKRRELLTLNRKKMGAWEAIEYLNTLVDDSDPDTDLTQIEHLLQTSEAIRADGHPDWFVLTGLIHDLGKILCLWDEPQWAVVGDTFPVGCAFSPEIVFPEYFKENPDTADANLQSRTGIYHEGCGLNNVYMSWGHDEYMYHVVKDYLPEEALYMIRFHSFYSWHRAGDYQYLMDDKDREMLPWVQKFNPYDLYSKTPDKPSVKEVKPYYEDLIAKYLPATLSW